jgi:BMFP domain-containing protein YqiC
VKAVIRLVEVVGLVDREELDRLHQPIIRLGATETQEALSRRTEALEATPGGLTLIR